MLIEECHAQEPPIPVVLVTGSADVTQDRLTDADAILPKPFELDELLAAVRNLARVRARVEAAELFNWRVASRQEQGELNPADASAMKVFGTELRIESLRLLMEVVGAAGTLKKGSAGAVLAGNLEVEYAGATIGTFGGGVNEIQREIIGMAGLRMPRVPR